MPNFRLVYVLTFTTMVFSELAEGPQPVLQRTVEAMFGEGEGEGEAAGACRLPRASPAQERMCRREPGLAAALAAASREARACCRDAFRYERWNCSASLDGRSGRSIFTNVYRETALAHALVAASIAHSVARACAAGHLQRCACAGAAPPGAGAGAGRAWKRGGCGDDLKHGRRVANDFLELKRAGTDHIAEVLKRDVSVGVRAVAAHAREVCKCHGFSGSCTTKTCWRRVGPFDSTMAALKRHYHRAVRRRLPNRTTRGGGGGGRGRRLVYVQRGPDLCAGTRGRRCRDPDNCATLCCGRGYSTRRAAAAEEERCRCRMVSCCRVRCDVCRRHLDLYVCK